MANCQNMKVAISQSNYIPWKGYFDMIAKSDVFVLYDEMQYTRRDWRNRNKIKTPNGLIWLTIPVKAKGNYYQKINEIRVSDRGWAKKHLKSIELNYKKAAYFETVFPLIEQWYKEAAEFDFLSEINRFFLEKICDRIGIKTRLVNSSQYTITGSKTEALISILDQMDNVDVYISGPSAKDYLNTTPFQSRDIEIEWMDYQHYPEYTQLYGSFEHGVSVLDVLLNCGFESTKDIIPTR